MCVNSHYKHLATAAEDTVSRYPFFSNVWLPIPSDCVAFAHICDGHGAPPGCVQEAAGGNGFHRWQNAITHVRGPARLGLFAVCIEGAGEVRLVLRVNLDRGNEK